jgi:hypothetical protein
MKKTAGVEDKTKRTKKNRRQKPAVKRTGDAHPLTAAFRAKLKLVT